MCRKILENLMFQYLESVKPKDTVFYTALQMSRMNPFLTVDRKIYKILCENFLTRNNCHLSNEYYLSILLTHFHGHHSFGLILFNNLLWFSEFWKLYQTVKCLSVRICFKMLRTKVWLRWRCSWLKKLDIPHALNG